MISSPTWFPKSSALHASEHRYSFRHHRKVRLASVLHLYDVQNSQSAPAALSVQRVDSRQALKALSQEFSSTLVLSGPMHASFKERSTAKAYITGDHLERDTQKAIIIAIVESVEETRRTVRSGHRELSRTRGLPSNCRPKCAKKLREAEEAKGLDEIEIAN